MEIVAISIVVLVAFAALGVIGVSRMRAREQRHAQFHEERAQSTDREREQV